jgi:hypothetical protein
LTWQQRMRSHDLIDTQLIGRNIEAGYRLHHTAAIDT